jgi:hypothetical protein
MSTPLHPDDFDSATPSISGLEEFLDTVLDFLNPGLVKRAATYIADVLFIFAFIFALVNPSGTFTTSEKGWVTISALALLALITIVRLWVDGKLKSVLSSVFVGAAQIHADHTSLTPPWSSAAAPKADAPAAAPAVPPAS